MSINPMLLTGFASIVLLASCASDNNGNEPNGPSGSQKTLTVSLNNAGTRVTNITGDPGAGVENTINNAVVAISDASGNIKTIQQATIVTSNSNSTASITTTSLDPTNDSVLVAVNVPNISGFISGTTTSNVFHSRTISIDNALSMSSTYPTTVDAETGYYLPMSGSAGKSDITSTGGNYTVKLNVFHLAAKITLSTLSVNFATGGSFPNATFTPTEIFLYNVPDNLCYTYNSAPWSTIGNYYQGESTTSANSNYKKYLGTGVMTSGLQQTLKGITGASAKYSGSFYFYTMPNNGATANDTRLILKGNFVPDATVSNPTPITVYYPISINHVPGSGAAQPTSGLDKCVYPNRNYQLTVTIQGRGNNNPGDPVDPATVTATLNVQNFTGVPQTNTFN